MAAEPAPQLVARRPDLDGLPERPPGYATEATLLCDGGMSLREGPDA